MSNRKQLNSDEYVQGIVSGDRVILSQAITLVESALPEHQYLADDIIEKCLPQTGASIRIGITGVPGVGKSTFIEAFGQMLSSEGKKIAVLAVDPSSSWSKGSILGDKTRMAQLTADPQVFIRPSPSAGSLGGVARRTRETMLLCEAAGFDTIIVETVGVGQSETTVYSMVDFFLLLAITGAGDELQGIKRGIIEMADAIAITKADQDNEAAALRAQAQYQNVIHMLPLSESEWQPGVFTCSAHLKKGLDQIWMAIQKHISRTKASNYFLQRRRRQAHEWMHQLIEEQLNIHFFSNDAVRNELSLLEDAVLNQRMSPRKAARKLMGVYLDA